MRQVEVRSIEVLDEEQDSVGPGVRVGFAVRGAEAEELKESYALVTEPSRVVQRLSVRRVTVAVVVVVNVVVGVVERPWAPTYSTAQLALMF